MEELKTNILNAITGIKKKIEEAIRGMTRNDESQNNPTEEVQNKFKETADGFVDRAKEIAEEAKIVAQETKQLMVEAANDLAVAAKKSVTNAQGKAEEISTKSKK